MVLRHVATPLHSPAARHGGAQSLAQLLRLHRAAAALRSASSFFTRGGAGALLSLRSCKRRFLMSCGL